MTFEQFERASPEELKAQAKQCFDLINDAQIVNEFQVAKLLEAQFYMQELDRREDSRIAIRDFRLEVAVIALIFIEIILSVAGILLAIKQGNGEDKLMDKQNTILANLQNSTSDTGEAMKELAVITKAMSDNTAESRKTLSSVDKGVHDQLAMFYDPSVLLFYDTGTEPRAVGKHGPLGSYLERVQVKW